MKIMHGIAFLALALSAAACSGIDDDTPLKALDSNDVEELCSEVKAETKDCGNGVTVTKDPSDCKGDVGAIPDSCTATVGDYRACEAADPCEAFNNSACAKLIQCASKR
jgi:hypothetical protein